MNVKRSLIQSAFSRNLLCFCVFLLLIFLSAAAQESSYMIRKRHISTEDGLPDRNVNCGIQDKFGFLWFGTRSGLCRYDGIKFTFLTRKTHGLRGSSILSLVADDSLGIMITYSLPGSSLSVDSILDVVNIKTLEVQPFNEYYASAPFDELAVDRVIYRKNKPLNFLLFNDHQHLWEYTASKGFVKKPLISKPLVVNPGVLLHPSESAILKANEFLNENFVLTQDSTLVSFDLTNLVMLMHRDGYILICWDFSTKENHKSYFLTYDGVLRLLDEQDRVENTFLNFDVDIPAFNFDESNLTISPYADQQTAILELVDRSIVFYSSTVGFEVLFRPEENIRVKSFFEDRLGSWWLSTSDGIYKVTARERMFRKRFSRDDSRFSFNNSTRGIYVDEEVACVNLYDAPVIVVGGDTIMFPIDQNFAVVRSNNVLWLGRYHPVKFDIATRALTYGPPSRKAEIWSILLLSDDEMFLGCTAGLLMFDVKKGTLHEVEYGRYPVARFVYKIFRNSDKEIMAVAENGIYIVSDTGEVLDFYSNYAASSDRLLPCKSIQDVYEDTDGVYWIASSYEGLFKWDKVNHTFEQFGIESGFLSTTTYCIQEDDFDNLWISTDYGLAKFDKQRRSAVTFREEDGISDNEFNRSSSFKDAEGILYFGGMNGVTSFDPADFEKLEKEQTYDFFITELIWVNSRNGATRDVKEGTLSSGRIVLSEAIRQVSLKFILLDYEDRQHRYAYKIEGLDNEWNYTTENNIQIGNLPYGKYSLIIKAQLADGKWNDQEIRMQILKESPFYKEWWFLVLVLLVTICCVVVIVQLRTRVLQIQKAKLEHTIEDRTHELKLSLDEQKAMLQEIHHRVKNNLQFIEAIIGMQINASKSASDEKVLMDINRRIHAMTLVHDMLYNKDRLQYISIRQYLEELVDKQVRMTEGDKKEVTVDLDVEDFSFDINSCLALGMITSELISNSFKHAFNDNEAPKISVRLVGQKASGEITYSISDNGVGLSEDQLSSGLGLRLIDIFSRQLGGSYKIFADRGCSFVLVFKLLKREEKKYTLVD